MSGSLWQYYKDNDNLADSESFRSKIEITGNSPNNGDTTYVQIIVPLKYLNNFWRILEMQLTNCEVNLILTWSSTFVISNSTGEKTFYKTDTKLYTSVVILSEEDNANFLQQIKSGFKRTINWNKYQSDPKAYAQNRF